MTTCCAKALPAPAQVNLQDKPSSKDPAPEPTVKELRYQLSMSVDEEAYKLIERAKELLSGRFPKGVSLEQVLEVAVGEYVDRHAPECRQKRREARKARKTNKKLLNIARAKRVSAENRDKVRVASGNQCCFVGADGTRCSARHNLQIEHLHPQGLGGGHDLGNLSVYCQAHNLHSAKKVYGSDKIEGYIRRER